MLARVSRLVELASLERRHAGGRLLGDGRQRVQPDRARSTASTAITAAAGHATGFPTTSCTTSGISAAICSSTITAAAISVAAAASVAATTVPVTASARAVTASAGAVTASAGAVAAASYAISTAAGAVAAAACTVTARRSNPSARTTARARLPHATSCAAVGAAAAHAPSTLSAAPDAAS